MQSQSAAGAPSGELSGLPGEVLPMRDLLARAWDNHCERYLPAKNGDFWRYNRSLSSVSLPHFGWKIHISATVLTAVEVIPVVAEVAANNAVLFKAPASIDGIASLNQGLGGHYSQVGKIFTVYPPDEAYFKKLINELVPAVPAQAWPPVPFDIQVHSDKPVFYRYGVINPSAAIDGRENEIQSPSGEWHVDERGPGMAAPVWITDPLLADGVRSPVQETGEQPKYAALQVLSQRGKGGVYLGYDLESRQPRLCVLKEGRLHGETDYSGEDGSARIKREYEALQALSHLDCVPQVYGLVEQMRNQYLKMQPIAGCSLSGSLAAELSGPSLRQVCLTLVESIRSVHSSGWLWNDCKPANIILRPRGRVCLLDFEGACPIRSPLFVGYGSPGYSAPDKKANHDLVGVSDDIFAAGVVLHELCGGRMDLSRGCPRLVEDIWRIPSEARPVFRAMRESLAEHRPKLEEVCHELRTGTEWTGVT